MKAIPQSHRWLSRCNWLVFMAFPGVMFASLALSENIPRSERIIINADERNALTTVSNLSNSDYSIEAWVESEQSEKEQPSPFIVMPAIFKVRSGEEQVMRIIKTPGKLPDYRESLFYFHIQKISTISEPGEPEHMEVSRASIKLIYRPG
ncbi:fimbria/pilus periplasmic chaperone, partial [Pseudomonas protegens]|uniref:fimbria/pilus periplasmic chaperone n=1 Tax=Pseudomonas protegens TaxID=380021 RepID=UPI003905DDAB